MTKEEIDKWLAAMPPSNRQLQFNFCLNAALEIKRAKSVLSWHSIVESFPDGVIEPEWQASRGRLTAMILQAGIHGILEPVFAEYHPDEFQHRPSSSMRKMLMRGRNNAWTL